MVPRQQPTQRERIECRVFPRAQDAGIAAAGRIAELVRSRQREGRCCVLGLATGSTPVGVYDELVRMHTEEGLSLANVVTFNLDEYYPMQPEELQSYAWFMREYLFDRVDIPARQIHIPAGTVAEAEVDEYCRKYEQAIADADGIDIQILGIGRTGHIGFNEPGSNCHTRTRLIALDRVTRIDAASDFFGEQHVPRRAITMGVGTILDAREIILIAFGEQKAAMVAEAVEGEVTASVPASYLQQHNNAVIYLDTAAAESLSRYRCPWQLGPVRWDEKAIRKAVIWLARKLHKPILKLTEEDYNEDGLQDLAAQHGSAYDINLAVFRYLQSTITGWPGGKPEHARQPGDRPQTLGSIFPKRILIFSPHPDDDVISMGGTLIRLVEQGHEVHVAYQTSGNIAVFDDDAIRYAEFVADYNRLFGADEQRTSELEAHVEQFLQQKRAGHVDSPEVGQIKALVRRAEARSATRSCGLAVAQLHFMDMPFYDTGRVKKAPLTEEDVRLVVELLERLEPHQIYAAGDLSDPHGTHQTCLRAVLKACLHLKQQRWCGRCEVWLYRGAWLEWSPHEIEMAVPLSPAEVLRKRVAIFKHESQKDKALFPGADLREFWQRAEDRNAETARIYDALGLAEYQAVEGFVRWNWSDDRPCGLSV